MKNRCLAVLAALMLMAGFAACREKAPPYLVIKYIDDDEQDSHVVEMTYKGTFKDWCAVEWNSRLFLGVKGVTLSNGTELRKLTKIDSGDLKGLTRIGSGAFYDCDSLESVSIPEGMTKIGYDAFGNCENLDVTYKGTFKDWCAADWDGSFLRNAKSITLSDGIDPRKLTKIDAGDLNGVTRIGREAFYDCDSFESVTIPEGVTEIGGKTFMFCDSLKSVTIPKSMKKIDSYTFSGCKDFDVNYKGTFKVWCAVDWNPDSGLNEDAKSITLSDGIDPRKLTKIDASDLKGVTRIGSGAFSYCASLESVTIPEGVTEIGWRAFDDCESLKSVNIPKSMKKIDSVAFWGCSSLKRIGIPSGVTEIGHCVFLGCTALESVIIPRSVTSIGGCVFADCSPNLKIQYDGTKAQWDAIDKEGDNCNFVIQCTDGTITEDGFAK